MQKFFQMRKAHKRFTETITFSKRIIKFEDYYTELLQNQLLDLESSLQENINKELSNDNFSISHVKIKKVSY